ncbi:MAG: hypothetical protein KGL39_17630 [Patescibacteria group bacterium]|nr:hypothetical protein [Patescibacteria group bacterium]
MILSKSQQQRFWREWAAACRAQGWTRADGWSEAQIDSQRHQLLQECGFDSLTEVDRTAGFDKVLAALQTLQSLLDGALEAEDPTIGESRRIRHVIVTELLPCLALYEPSPTGYLQTVITGHIRWNKTDRPARPPTLEDLTTQPIVRREPPCYELKAGPSQLHQVLMTLTARLDAKRREFGHTVHDMRRGAGLECHCKRCAAQRAAAAEAEQHPEIVPLENQPF